MSALSRRVSWGWAPALLAVSILVALFFWKMATSNLILARGDTFLYFYPYWTAAAEALRAGRLPLWNPAIFMGAPFLANSQAGVLYPLNWPLWLIFSAPYAVSATILLHAVIAGMGTYLLGRRLLGLGQIAALFGAALFALGGYYTAQVEHVNQFQGLAWLPWYFVAVGPLAQAESGGLGPGDRARSLLPIAGLLALQLLAGHTQTAFISGIAAGIWLLAGAIRRTGRGRYLVNLVAVLLSGAALAALLAAVQLVPTLELTGLSSRQGGLALSEALSFSWHPLHISRSLLPDYSQSLFSEFVAFLPLTALVLALVGAWPWRRRPELLPWLVLTGAALFLALGQFTPLYWLLAQLPVFNLFRVPARWLAIYGLGAAVLAARGWQDLLNLATAEWAAASEQRTIARRQLLVPALVAAAVIALLVVWSFAGIWLGDLLPTAAEAPYEAPAATTMLGWAFEALLFAALFGLALAARPVWSRAAAYGLVVLVLAALWAASRSQPYNNLTTPEAYFDLRPPQARLVALADCAVPDLPCSAPPDRMLSLSDIFFDPGDQAEIDSIYVDQLDETARYDYTIAIKQKEVIAPNLPMVNGLASVDGFDGGVLPLRSYSDLTALILPEGVASTDGRLREYLATVPENRWLDLFNARYVITDKVGDEWREGVYFDRQFATTLDGPEGVPVGDVAPFEATELWLLSAQTPPDVEIVTDTDGIWRLTPEPTAEADRFRFVYPEPAEARSITLLPCAEANTICQVDALSLVDGRDNTFQPLTPGPFRLIHSGDVKLYDKLDVLPRARMVYDWEWQTDEAAAVSAMADTDFDPRQSAVLIGSGLLPDSGEGQGEVDIISYEPEAMTLHVTTDSAGLLVVADAYYPGWVARVDGEDTPILQANGLFRGIMLPAGSHDVELSYEPAILVLGASLTIAGLLVVVVAIIALRRRAY